MSECTCCCSVWLNVWFSPRVTSPFLCFFIYHYCCAELLALVAACLLSCFRFMHHSCTVCIVVSTLQVQVYTCVWWHVLGKGGRTHGPFICCSHSSLVLRDLHIVCAKKKKKRWKKRHILFRNRHKLRSIVIVDRYRTSMVEWIVRVLCHFQGAQY